MAWGQRDRAGGSRSGAVARLLRMAPQAWLATVRPPHSYCCGCLSISLSRAEWLNQSQLLLVSVNALTRFAERLRPWLGAAVANQRRSPWWLLARRIRS